MTALFCPALIIIYCRKSLFGSARGVFGRCTLLTTNPRTFADTHTQTELLDDFTKTNETAVQLFGEDLEENEDKIGFRDAVFSWSNDSTGAQTPSKRKFLLRVEDEVLFRRGCINLITGPTGSGKTTMLMALLGG